MFTLVFFMQGDDKEFYKFRLGSEEVGNHALVEYIFVMYLDTMDYLYAVIIFLSTYIC